MEAELAALKRYTVWAMMGRCDEAFAESTGKFRCPGFARFEKARMGGIPRNTRI